VKPFRKSGSLTRFYLDGTIPDPSSDEFLTLLAGGRFRTIENAASEETSLGWVCPSDASGGSFAPDSIVLSRELVRLRFRRDKKKLPAQWLALYMEAELRNRPGRKVSAKERKEIKQDIAAKLCPRILPSIRLTDVVYEIRKRCITLFSTSQSAKEDCQKLFYDTFGCRLVEADPWETAFHLELPRDNLDYLERVAALPMFPDGGRQPELLADTDTDEAIEPESETAPWEVEA